MTSRSPRTRHPRGAARRGAVPWRRVQLRVHDVRQPGFAAECDRQARVIGGAQKDADGAEDWFAASDTAGWT